MAEVQNFSINRASKEAIKALALGLDMEKKVMLPASKKLTEVLGYKISQELTPEIIRKIDRGLNKAGVIFQSNRPRLA